MFKFHTLLSVEQIRMRFEELVASSECENAEVCENRFRLRAKEKIRNTPVPIYGHFAPAEDGTTVHFRPETNWPPFWFLPVGFLILLWFHAPMWLVIPMVLVHMFGYVRNARIGYDLLRKACGKE